jgi:hypothetical protein
MPSSSKTKGTRYERELVDGAAACGLAAERAWGSNGRALGHHEEVDVLIEGLKIQAKRRARIADYLKPNATVDAVAITLGNSPAGEAVMMADGYAILHQQRRKLAKHLVPSEHVDAVAVRADYGETLIIMRWSQFAKLLPHRDSDANNDDTLVVMPWVMFLDLMDGTAKAASP